MIEYYGLLIEIYGEDWERSELEIFKTKQEAEDYQLEYESDHKRDGEYIPNIYNIEYKIIEYTDKQIRNIVSVNKYLALNPDVMI